MGVEQELLKAQTVIQKSIGKLNREIGELKTALNSLTNSVTDIAGRVLKEWTEIQQTISTLNREMGELKVKAADLDKRMKEIEAVQENHPAACPLQEKKKSRLTVLSLELAFASLIIGLVFKGLDILAKVCGWW